MNRDVATSINIIRAQTRRERWKERIRERKWDLEMLTTFYSLSVSGVVPAYPTSRVSSSGGASLPPDGTTFKHLGLGEKQTRLIPPYSFWNFQVGHSLNNYSNSHDLKMIQYFNAPSGRETESLKHFASDICFVSLFSFTSPSRLTSSSIS